MKGMFISLLSILVLLLAGCEATTPKDISRPIRLYADPTRPGFFDPAVAVGKDGMKYFAWSECYDDDQSNCDIVVTWTIAGETHDPVIVQRPAGAYDRYPDITVTDDGMVYLVWERQVSSRSDCWAKFDPASPGPVTCRVLGREYFTNFGKPKIASYGNTVYAVFGFWSSYFDASFSRYRQLNPLDRSSGRVSLELESGKAGNWAIAVSSADTLHVAWVDGSCDTVEDCRNYLFYGNNLFTSGDFPVYHNFGPRPSLSSPVISVAPLDNNRVYLASTASNELISFSIPDDGFGTPVPGKDLPTEDWAIDGGLSMAINEANGSSSASIAFSASRATSKEIYVKDFNGDPVAQTNDDVDDVEPQIVFLKEKPGSFINFQVLVWWVQDSKGNYVQVYEKTTALAPQVIYDGPSKYGFVDLAANGPWVAGVWGTSDKYLSKHGLMAAFNVHQLNLPIILK